MLIGIGLNSNDVEKTRSNTSYFLLACVVSSYPIFLPSQVFQEVKKSCISKIKKYFIYAVEQRHYKYFCKKLSFFFIFNIKV